MSNTDTVKIGRPETYTKELGETICKRIALGESVRKIVKDDDMPSSSMIYRWLLDEDKKEFWEQYEKAINARAELMFEELLEIADDGTNDYVEILNDSGGTITTPNKEHVQRSRLRVDTRKWYLSKIMPKKFGDKMDVTSNGKTIKGNSIIFTDFTDETNSEQEV